MEKERWQEISKIFNSALEKKTSERKDFLAKACGEDENLRQEIELLLNAHESKDSFIDAQISPEIPSLDLKKGDSIASFEIEKLLGKGGMGEVYLAKDKRLNRNVALKILPPANASDPSANKRLLREAQAAAVLEHPHICTIHEIGESGGNSFIVMQYVDGETLSDRLKQTKLSDAEAITIAIQVAEALTEAHARGVVHRDIKPANVVISNSNQIKVLDFGLAKRTEKEVDSESLTQSLLSHPGLILGTASYMSPEQTRGDLVDGRSDLWSLGVCLYEMTIGKTPFSGNSIVEKFVAILHDEPTFPETFNDELKRIISKLLQKNRDERYQNADELLTDLRKFKENLEFEELLKTHTSISGDRFVVVQNKPEPKQIWRKRLIWVGLAILLSAIGVWYFWQNSNIIWAKESIKKVEELAQNDKNFEAYDLALKIEKYLPNDENLVKIMPTISDKISVNSEPNGAKIYLKRFLPEKDGKFPERQLIGTTPIADTRIARGSYVLQIEKDGFAKFERTISGTIPRIGDSFIDSPPIKVETKLIEADKVPERMTLVSAGEYSLVNWSRSSQNKVPLDDFFIDKYEVTNKEYKEFIVENGYKDTSFWNYPFIKDGKEIPAGEALKEFKDKTGLPAPRNWTNQNYPEGKENFPVTDITWYEAAAYAKFRKKTLPTVFQWEKAARNSISDPRYNAMPWGLIRQGETTDFRANFGSNFSTQVDNFEFGMSPFGVFNMAGNVAEWCLNRSEDNYVTSGGAFNNLPYSFGDYGEYPGFYTSDKIGFRCVLNVGSEKNQGADELPPPEIPTYKPTTEVEHKTWLPFYKYDKSPLNAQTVETKEFDAWTREKITFIGENNEQAIGYLYLPKYYKQPLQVIHYVPPGDVVAGLRSLPDSVDMFLAPIIKSGRAVWTVVLKGYNERPFPNNYTPPERNTVEFRKQAVNWMTDLQRGLDYLETRQEVDFKRVTFLGISNGANLGLLITGVENRYDSAIFCGVGVDKAWQKWIPEANFINFAPHSKMPKLIINGRYDEAHPLKTFAEPLYKIMSEPKKLVIYDGGHIPTIEFFATTTNTWLDEKLGTPIK
ncbi:MAG: protein kinase [Pyrinomonadaceae bacterium]|nr:protein kinase [Pyrinomonadaceae bacterium]